MKLCLRLLLGFICVSPIYVFGEWLSRSLPTSASSFSYTGVTWPYNGTVIAVGAQVDGSIFVILCKIYVLTVYIFVIRSTVQSFSRLIMV